MTDLPPLIVEPTVALCAKHGRALPWPDAFPAVGLWLLMAMLSAPEVVALVPKDEDGKALVEKAMPMLREYAPWCESEFLERRDVERVLSLAMTKRGLALIYAELKQQQDDLRNAKGEQ